MLKRRDTRVEMIACNMDDANKSLWWCKFLVSFVVYPMSDFTTAGLIEAVNPPANFLATSERT